MTSVPLGQSAYKRSYAQEPEIFLLNRFLEKSPSNLVEQIALLSRPGNTFFVGAGVGPIRAKVHQEGVHSGDLFIVSNDTLYRYDGVNPPIAIAGTVAGSGEPAITLVAGPGYDHLFIADGVTLQYYDGEAAANGTLTSTGVIIDTDTVTIDTVYYAWTAGSVDAGTPAGTIANPWLVALGVSDTEALANLLQALDVTGTAGTTYSTGLSAHTTVGGVASTATTLDVAARVRGVAGNTIATTETGAAISWGSPTLSGGGAQSLHGITTPDDVGMVSLATLDSFVICVVTNTQRFYWIQPGAIIIDALDFATAESEPDQLVEVKTIGDSLYFLGNTSTEVWYATGAVDIPFLRQQGLAFSQGAIAGTAVAIRTQIIVVAEDGVVYKIAGGPQRISNSGIEERIRKARKALAGA